MNASPTADTATASWSARWQRFSAGLVRAFHAYGNWLISISWRRFILLSAILLVGIGIIHDEPPLTWRFTERVENHRPRIVVMPPQAPKPPVAPVSPPTPPSPRQAESSVGDLQISIGKDGIRIVPNAAKGAASAASGAEAGVEIKLPPGVTSEIAREAIAEARRQIEEALRREQEQLKERREEAEQAVKDAEAARRDAEAALEALTKEQGDGDFHTRVTRIGIGDFLLQLSWLWVLGSAVLKYTYKGRVQAEVKAAQATETAEAESLKRQVVEARMAAMQAQVEPHFLFNTLASIDHLIETDPQRASQMQKNLIALLRASMPSMREASGNGNGGLRELGRELAVIRPYLEILKVRMEERLVTDIQVPDGLLSAEFPPMMIQTLVENAIKHGLEPKAEGGSLTLKAEIVHGKLQVTVADTGLGFGKAATAGTGVGLANIRERLQLLYGARASLTVAENAPSGTVVQITVPYKTVEGSYT
ncbi:MAG: histidine kinase [Rubrivivax sp.]|nr:histidine kinase [Rubrivivax sp.]